jgi:hypothetical protein
LALLGALRTKAQDFKALVQERQVALLGALRRSWNESLVFLRRPHFNTPNCLPTSVNAAIARSICSVVCAADTCIRMRAWPCGTTG